MAAVRLGRFALVRRGPGISGSRQITKSGPGVPSNAGEMSEMGKFLPPELREEVKQALLAGEHYLAIHDRLRVSAFTIYQIKRELGLASRKYHKWSARQVEILRREWAAGTSTGGIAQLTQFDKRQVLQKAEILGLPRRGGRLWTNHEIARAVELRKTGMSITRIAEALDRHEKCVWKYLKREGFKSLRADKLKAA
jgi:hypothetical protein